MVARHGFGKASDYDMAHIISLALAEFLFCVQTIVFQEVSYFFDHGIYRYWEIKILH